MDREKVGGRVGVSEFQAFPFFHSRELYVIAY